MTSVGQLLREGLIEQVARDIDGAASELDQARRHLEAARLIVDVDPNGAYQLAYDGARKATVAHMRAEGLRVPPNAPGSHATTARYAGVVLGDTFGRRLDAMRRKRNRSEYGVAYIEAAEVSQILEHAAELVHEVRHRLG